MGTMRSLPNTPSKAASEATSAVFQSQRRDAREDSHEDVYERANDGYDQAPDPEYHRPTSHARERARGQGGRQLPAGEPANPDYDAEYDADRAAGQWADHDHFASPDSGPEPGPNYVAIEQSAEFRQLRRRLLLFVFPVAFLALSWYLIYIFFAAYAHEFMSRRLFGSVTMGLALGLAQYVTTIAITVWYVAFARRKLDPAARSIREQVDRDLAARGTVAGEGFGTVVQ